MRCGRHRRPPRAHVRRPRARGVDLESRTRRQQVQRPREGDERRGAARREVRSDSRNRLAQTRRLHPRERRQRGVHSARLRTRTARRTPARRGRRGHAQHEGAHPLRRVRGGGDGGPRRARGRERPRDPRRRDRHAVHGPARDRQHGLPLRADRPRDHGTSPARVRARRVADASVEDGGRLQVERRAPERRVRHRRAHRAPLLPGVPLGRHQARPPRVDGRHASRDDDDPRLLRRAVHPAGVARLHGRHHEAHRLDEHDAVVHALVDPQRVRVVVRDRRRGVSPQAPRLHPPDVREPREAHRT